MSANSAHEWITSCLKMINKKTCKIGRFFSDFMNEPRNRSVLNFYIDSINEDSKLPNIIEKYENLTTLFFEISKESQSEMRRIPLLDLLEQGRRLENSLQEGKDEFYINLIKRLRASLERLESLKREESRRKLKQDEADQRKFMEELKAKELTYKTTPILPTGEDEIVNTTLPSSLVHHIKKGSYLSWEFYANNLFHCLREVLNLDYFIYDEIIIF